MKFLCLFMLLVFFSCSNSNDVEMYSLGEAKTLRKTAEDIDIFLQWNDSNVAEENSNSTNSESLNLHEKIVENENAIFFVESTDDGIYPFLDGFGSLNSASISRSLFSLIDDFVESLQNNSLEEVFFAEEKSYLKTIIEYNFREYSKYSSYLIGEAFAFDNPKNSYEIPIRFFYENDTYMDCFLYCRLKDDTYVIEQFDIGIPVNE